MSAAPPQPTGPPPGAAFHTSPAAPSSEPWLPPPVAGVPIPVRASVVSRFLAILIDTIILAVVALIIILPFGLFAVLAFPVVAFAGGFFLIEVVVALLGLLYFTYFEHRTGQTFGKRLVGIRVVDARTGGPISLAHSFLRNLLRLVDMLPFLYLIGFVVIELSAKHQRLGDVVADTLVVRA